MIFVFQRDYVAAGGRGFVAGMELPDGVLTKTQIDALIAVDILKMVVSVEVFLQTEPAVEEEVVVEEDPIERLDPEKTVRKKRR